MSPSAILYPVLVQVILTLAVLLMMGPARSRSLREQGQSLDDSDVRIGRNTWSEQATKLSNNYKNQFELPVLFYAACAFALALREVDGLMIGLAWVFALSRIVHTIIHVGVNIVIWRGIAFLVGMVALLGLWLVLAWRIWIGV